MGWLDFFFLGGVKSTIGCPYQWRKLQESVASLAKVGRQQWKGTASSRTHATVNTITVGKMNIPSGKLTLLWKITIFIGKIHYKWPCSIAMLNYQRVNQPLARSVIVMPTSIMCLPRIVETIIQIPQVLWNHIGHIETRLLLHPVLSVFFLCRYTRISKDGPWSYFR
jgi:hypothetical protein